MTNIKVSVVIPVYNAGKYLEEAVGSITGQTLREIEIIVVNDGSTDNSAQVLERLAQQDSRITILTHEENQGPGGARNSGMEIIRGEYVYFFDSDDILEADCLELCYAKSEKDDLDFVFFDAVMFYDYKPGLNFWYQRTGKLTPKIYSGTEILEVLLRKKLYRDTLWINFIKTSYLKGLNLCFIPANYFDDVPFVMALYLNANRVSYIGRSFFHRRVRENSIMSSKMTERKINDFLTVSAELEKYKTQYPDAKKLLNMKNRMVLNYVIKKLLLLDIRVIMRRMPQVVRLYLRSLW